MVVTPEQHTEQAHTAHTDTPHAYNNACSTILCFEALSTRRRRTPDEQGDLVPASRANFRTDRAFQDHLSTSPMPSCAHKRVQPKTTAVLISSWCRCTKLRASDAIGAIT